MNPIQILSTQPWVEHLGMTLIHFLWQGAIIVAIYAFARKCVRGSGPNGRYFLACAALTAMAIAPAATWILLRAPAPESVAATFTAPMSAARTEPARSMFLSLSTDADRALPGAFLSWVVAFWLAGATAFSLRLLGGWIVAERLRSTMARPVSAEWQGILDRLRSRISISRPVRLLVSGLVEAPAAVGWLRPVVLAPAGALAGLPAAQVEALLLHELAHIRRHDYLVQVGVPSSLTSRRYQIDAKADAAASRGQMFLMLQSLLEDRFQLKTHREMKEMPVFALVANKGGLKLQAPKEGVCVDSPADAEWVGAGRMAAPGEVQPIMGRCGSAVVALGPRGAEMKGGKIAMPELARILSKALGRSVIDQTGFRGLFDLQLDFVPDDTTPSMPPPPPNAGISDITGVSIAQALQQQLGLSLQSTKGPVQVIVVDQAAPPSVN